MKKLLSVILAVVMLISVCAIGVSADDEKLNYLLLGDSIAYGAGVLNSRDACYGKMVANTNGYNYVNDSVNGHRTADLIDLLNKPNIKNDVKNADIISISIGGNDFLRSNFLELVVCSFINNDAPFKKIQEKFYENFSTIIEMIKAENPDALILVQTVYNMRHDFLTKQNEIASNLLNESIVKYLEENPDSYVIVDVAAALYGRGDCLAIDTIHPNGRGNIVIAKCILNALNAEGIGTATEPVILVQPIEQYAFALYPFIKLFELIGGTK